MTVIVSSMNCEITNYYMPSFRASILTQTDVTFPREWRRSSCIDRHTESIELEPIGSTYSISWEMHSADGAGGGLAPLALLTK